MKTQTLTLDDFHQRFGRCDTSHAICAFTPPGDTHVVLTLLAQARPRRILEIGTALGHMTANFSEWSPPDALIYTLGTVEDVPATVSTPQRSETPPRALWGRFANHFGKVEKVCFISADSLRYDFARLAPVDFAFLDGAHDFGHVTGDTLQVYRVLHPGGWMVWHDFGSRVPWVEVRQALEQVQLAEPLYHVLGTEVAFLRKQADVEPGPAGETVASP